jgi:flagellin
MADFRSRMGAVSNRMFMTVDNLMNVSENTSSARSRIVDADFALESANLAKAQILQKAGTAMLSQANASTQDILSLLK